MSLTLAGIVVVLPFASAGLLACIGSWRTGVRINAASSSLLFALACLLPVHFASALAAHLVVLTSFVAMTASWFGWRDVRAALGTRRLDRYRTRLHHVAVQVLVGAMLLAIVSDSPALTWLGTAIAVAGAAALTGTVRTLTAQRATGRLLQLCGVALMLALFGTLLLHLAAAPEQASLQWSTSRFHLAPPDLAMLCLVLGYGGIAGLVPLHSWLPDAAAESTAPGAILITALLANVPLLAILRVRCTIADGPDAPVALLVILGLATLLVAGFCLLARRDTRRSLAFAGSAQTGIVVFAFGLGGRTATLAGLLLMTLTTLAKAAAL
jgi:hydrogenase-4 component F